MNKIFEKGGKLYWLHSTIDAFETFLAVPGTVAKKGAHVRDAVDLKRIMIIAVISAVPAAIFGMWNVGFQHSLATGLDMNIWQEFWFGFWKGLWYSLFHSVSAFCNAGFDLMGVREKYASLTGYAADLWVNTVIMLLIIIGGIGFLVWEDLRRNRLRVHRYRLQTKLVLVTSTILILVPAALKGKPCVTLLGKTSGGGSCVVRSCTSASGAVFAISSSNQISSMKNGSLYNADEGAEPDFAISRYETFYDREALVEFIHNLP